MEPTEQELKDYDSGEGLRITYALSIFRDRTGYGIKEATKAFAQAGSTRATNLLAMAALSKVRAEAYYK